MGAGGFWYPLISAGYCTSSGYEKITGAGSVCLLFVIWYLDVFLLFHLCSYADKKATGGLEIGRLIKHEIIWQGSNIYSPEVISIMALLIFSFAFWLRCAVICWCEWRAFLEINAVCFSNSRHILHTGRCARNCNFWEKVSFPSSFTDIRYVAFLQLSINCFIIYWSDINPVFFKAFSQVQFCPVNQHPIVTQCNVKHLTNFIRSKVVHILHYKNGLLNVF